MQEENLRLEDLLERIRVPDEKGVISKVAIIGAGVMGQGIAQTVAESGIDVLIIEQDNKCLDLAKNSLSEFIDNEIKRWAMTNSVKMSIFSRIDWETNLVLIN
jgi:3-hydroxybutyryl-CoA dehydrogenase